jgi:hypothetical protein
MQTRGARVIAAATIAMVIVATALILCVGPAHMTMAASEFGDGLRDIGGHAVFVGQSASAEVGSASALFTAVLAVALATGSTAFFAHRSELYTLVSVAAPDGPLYGRLRI